jgi:hypothetical protein
MLPTSNESKINTIPSSSENRRSQIKARQMAYQEGGSRLGRRTRDRDNIGLISFGVFVALIGVMYLLTPNISFEIDAFANDLNLVRISNIINQADCCYLPAPSSNHPVLYFAVAEFCFIFGLAQIVLLMVEFAQGLSAYRKSRTAGSIVFWLGAGYIDYSLSLGSITWFPSWAALIVVIGFSIIVRSVIAASFPKSVT